VATLQKKIERKSLTRDNSGHGKPAKVDDKKKVTKKKKVKKKTTSTTGKPMRGGTPPGKSRDVGPKRGSSAAAKKVREDSEKAIKKRKEATKKAKEAKDKADKNKEMAKMLKERAQKKRDEARKSKEQGVGRRKTPTSPVRSRSNIRAKAAATTKSKRSGNVQKRVERKK